MKKNKKDILKGRDREGGAPIKIEVWLLEQCFDISLRKIGSLSLSLGK